MDIDRHDRMAPGLRRPTAIVSLIIGVALIVGGPFILNSSRPAGIGAIVIGIFWLLISIFYFSRSKKS